MKMCDFLTSIVHDDRVRTQTLFDCTLSAKSVKRTKQCAAHTRIEFYTVNMTPDDLMYFTLSPDEAATCDRKPRHVGIIVWVPFEEYEKASTTPDAQ